MFVRNSDGKFVNVNVMLNEAEFYNTMWQIKFNKKLPAHNTVSVNKMKNYLNSKCFSL